MLKLVSVVILFPAVGNVIQFLVQDYILKMKDLAIGDYEIVCKYYETVLERESHYQEYNYFSKQVEKDLMKTEMSSLEDVKISSKY